MQFAAWSTPPIVSVCTGPTREILGALADVTPTKQILAVIGALVGIAVVVTIPLWLWNREQP